METPSIARILRDRSTVLPFSQKEVEQESAKTRSARRKFLIRTDQGALSSATGRAVAPQTGQDQVPVDHEEWQALEMRLRDRGIHGRHLLAVHTGFEDMDFLRRVRGNLETCRGLAETLPEAVRGPAINNLMQTEKAILDALRSIENARQTLAESASRDEALTAEIAQIRGLSGWFRGRRTRALLKERVKMSHCMIDTMFSVDRQRREILSMCGNYLDLVRGMLPPSQGAGGHRR